jgi:3(or 17)beta-hydroxysteroid dehydrogenase
MARFDGKTALVTGAASGLGEAIARGLAAEGARVLLTDIDPAGEAVARSLGGEAAFVRHDVSQEADWDTALAEMERRFGGLDILVNNAGITIMGDIESISFADYRKTMAIDTDGVFLGCQKGIPLLKRRGGGVITNISSISGLRASANLVAYNAAKAAVTLMTKSVALHCAYKGYGIRVNSVHPGVIRTAMLDKVMSQVEDPEALMAGFVATHPIGRVGEPHELISMVLYLSSAEASFMTGGSYVVDGGATAGG